MKIVPYTTSGALPFALICLASCRVAETGAFVFTNVHVVDVTDGVVIANQDVLVSGDRIETIADHGSFRVRGRQVIDGTDRFLVPGLWDMHVHTWEYQELFFPLLLANGVTGIRDMHNPIPADIVAWKDSINGSDSFAPRIGQVAGRLHNMVPTLFRNHVVATEQEAVAAVADRAGEGVDFFKMIIMNERLARTVFEEARRFDLPVVGHIPSQMDARMVSGLGMKSIEHVLGFCIAYSELRDSLLADYAGNGVPAGPRYFNDVLSAHNRIDTVALGATMATLRANETFVCPTLVVFKRLLSYYADGVMGGRLEYLPESTRRSIRDFMDGQYREAFADGIVQMDRYSGELMQFFRDYDVLLIAGTDASPTRPVVPGFSLHDELWYMQEPA